jgi:ABC-type transport system involved in multi-copper enzyme maturation permease subunit
VNVPTIHTTEAEPWSQPDSSLRFRQILAILRLEIRKSLAGRRLIFTYLLALAPVVLLGIRALLPLHRGEEANPGQAGLVYAVMFQLFMLRLAIFFGCMGIFVNLFRGEVLEKTLHYYLLAPLRRDILVAGKYLSGLLAAFLIFGLSTTVSFLLAYAPYGGPVMRDFFSQGAGTSQLLGYIGVVFLACLGYGAVFLLVGLQFRNPILPAAVILGWESINFLLPAFLQRVSVIHYLQSVCPVPIPLGPLAVLTEPTSVWLSTAGLLLVTFVAIGLATWKIRKTQITYESD